MAASLYTACVLGAVALYLIQRPTARGMSVAAAIAGLGALVWIFTQAAGIVDPAGVTAGPGPFFMIFAIIAVAAAVRMITHDRPVYAALYFVIVVLSSAGLFLLLAAEFMAFALVIVYAGAILITYLFVLMLAQQSPDAEDETGQAEYDRVPREPGAAAIVGFVLLAVLSDAVVPNAQRGTSQLPAAPTELQARDAAWRTLEQLPDRIEKAVLEGVPDMVEMVPDDRGRLLRLAGGDATVVVLVVDDETQELEEIEYPLPDAAMPENIEAVGLALVGKFPASLELAGVILLMAMFGAVVLAQRQIEAGQAERRGAQP